MGASKNVSSSKFTYLGSIAGDLSFNDELTNLTTSSPRTIYRDANPITLKWLKIVNDIIKK